MKREQKKLQTKARICNAAKQLFTEKGYESATIADITELAGVAKGTFFNYFDNKESLMLELHLDWVSHELHNLSYDQSEPTISKILQIGAHLATKNQLNKKLARTLFQSIMAHEKTLERHQQSLIETANVLQPLIQSGQKRGEIITDMSSHELAEAFSQAYYGAVMAWAMHPSQNSQLDHVTHALDWFIRGISKTSVEAIG